MLSPCLTYQPPEPLYAQPSLGCDACWALPLCTLMGMGMGMRRAFPVLCMLLCLPNIKCSMLSVARHHYTVLAPHALQFDSVMLCSDCQGCADLSLLDLMDDVDPNDVGQGRVGDCWLLSAISALAGLPVPPLSLTYLYFGDSLSRLGISCARVPTTSFALHT